MNRLAEEQEADRRAILLSVLALDRPVSELQSALSTLEWDYPIALAILTYSHVRSVLERFQAGQLRADDVEGWANMIELRDDLDFADEMVQEMIFILATPAINGALDQQLAEELLNTLQT